MLRQQPPVLYPRARLDALTDGIYAVAMTLLVLDVRLPEDFHPRSDAAMAQGLLALGPKLLPYVVSFTLLGMRWLGMARVRSRAEWLGGAYIRWWLLSLLVITCVPFSTIVVGRYASFAPAVWLYSANTALLAIATYAQLKLLPGVEDGRHVEQRQLSSLFLLFASLLCIALSLVNSAHALWAFVLYPLGPALWGRFGRAPGSARPAQDRTEQPERDADGHEGEHGRQ